MQTPRPPTVNFVASTDFVSWLQEMKLSVAVAMPKQNKLIIFGQSDGKLNIFNRTIKGCSSIHTTKNSLFVSSNYQIWKCVNIYTNSNTEAEYDALFLPKESWAIGNVDLHDMYVHEGIPPIFVSSLFSCIATLDEEYSFKVIWKPKFISKLVSEDRCHLNGMAVDPKRKVPRYATALSNTDSFEEWRLEYKTSGILIDIASDDIIADGLSLPYSPRIHQNKLYCLEAGRGALITVDPKTKKRKDVCLFPGFVRGLDFVGDYAIIGCSKPRRTKTFEGLEIETRLKQEQIEPQCGFFIVNLKTGEIEHKVIIEGLMEDIYDVKALLGIETPFMIGFQDDNIENVFYLKHEE